MLYINLYGIKNKLNIKGKEMLYVPKIGDIVKVNRMVGDDPKLLQNNQEVKNIIKIEKEQDLIEKSGLYFWL